MGVQTPVPTRISIQLQRKSRDAATSKMERFVIIVNGFQSLTIITKRCILDVLAALDPPLDFNKRFSEVYFVRFEMTQL